MHNLGIIAIMHNRADFHELGKICTHPKALIDSRIANNLITKKRMKWKWLPSSANPAPGPGWS